MFTSTVGAALPLWNHSMCTSVHTGFVGFTGNNALGALAHLAGVPGRGPGISVVVLPSSIYTACQTFNPELNIHTNSGIVLQCFYGSYQMNSTLNIVNKQYFNNQVQIQSLQNKKFKTFRILQHAHAHQNTHSLLTEIIKPRILLKQLSSNSIIGIFNIY